MNHLQYTSKEMFSSTELIRKSKMIFEKVSSKEIEKAIILRDGKPSFMLLDFASYEEIMSDYIALKEMLNKKELETKESKKKKTEVVEKEITEEKSPEIETLKNEPKIETINFDTEIEIVEERIPSNKAKEIDEINDLDLEEALAQIDKLDIEFDTNSNEVKVEEASTEEPALKKDTHQEKEPLKEFWE